MQDLGRYVFVAGIAIALLGAIVWIVGRSGFRGLPGDVSYQSDHVRVYFPIVSCLVLSALMTIAAMIWQRWMKR